MNTKSNQKTKKAGSVEDLVAKGLSLIASAFSDPYQHTDYQTGEISTRNALGFWQDKVLYGVCFQLANGLDYTRATSMPRAKEQVERAVRAHKGDELSEVALQRAVAWYQRLLEQEGTAQAALDEARFVYTQATGKRYDYTPRLSPNGATTNVVETPAMAAAKALGLSLPNVAPGFNAAPAIHIRAHGAAARPARQGAGKDKAATG